MLTILIDLDGVLADFERQRYLRLTQQGQQALPPAWVTDFYGRASYTRAYGKAAATVAREVCRSPGFFETMPAIVHGCFMFQALRRLGHTPIVCSKPLDEAPACTAEKQAWVESHLGPEAAQEMLLVKDKSKVPGDLLIDDRPNLRSYHAARGEGPAPWKHVLFTQPWNQDDTEADAHMLDWTDLRWLTPRVLRRLFPAPAEEARDG